jgi:hypothetical protein
MPVGDPANWKPNGVFFLLQLPSLPPLKIMANRGGGGAFGGTLWQVLMEDKSEYYIKKEIRMV